MKPRRKSRDRILYVEESKSVWLPAHRNKSGFVKHFNRLRNQLVAQGAHILELGWNPLRKRFFILARRRRYANSI